MTDLERSAMPPKHGISDADRSDERRETSASYPSKRRRISLSSSHDVDELHSADPREDAALSDNGLSDSSSDIFIKTRIYPQEIRVALATVYDRLLPIRAAGETNASPISTHAVSLALQAASVIDAEPLNRLAEALIGIDHEALQSLIPDIGKRLDRFRAPQQTAILKRVKESIDKTLADDSGATDLIQRLRMPVSLFVNPSENSSVQIYKASVLKQLSRHDVVADMVTDMQQRATAAERTEREQSTGARLAALSASLSARQARTLEKTVDEHLATLRQLARDKDPLSREHAEAAIANAVQLHDRVNGGEYRPALSKNQKKRRKGHAANIAKNETKAEADAKPSPLITDQDNGRTTRRSEASPTRMRTHSR